MSEIKEWDQVFVGRESELACLTEAWFRALSPLQPWPEFVVLAGEKGLGKTRIIQEFYKHLSQTFDEGEPKGYWPDTLGKSKHSLNINPRFEERKTVIPSKKGLPFLWWGIRAKDPNERNLAEHSKCAVINSGSHLEQHFQVLDKKNVNRSASESVISMLKNLASYIPDPSVQYAISAHDMYKEGKGLKHVKSVISDKITDIKDSLVKSDDVDDDDIYFNQYRFDPHQKNEDMIAFSINNLKDNIVRFHDLIHKENRLAIPFVIILDDAQWLDEYSLDFVRSLYEEAVARKWNLLFVCTHWKQEWYVNDKKNTGLPNLIKGLTLKDASESLLEIKPVQNLIPVIQEAFPGITENQVAVIHEKAGGNPLLLHEIIIFLRGNEVYFEGRNTANPLTVKAEERVRSKECKMESIVRDRFDESPMEVKDLLSYMGYLGEQVPYYLIRGVNSCFKISNIDETLEKSEVPYCYMEQQESGVYEFSQSLYRNISLQHLDDSGVSDAEVDEAVKDLLSIFLDSPSGCKSTREYELILSIALSVFNNFPEKKLYFLNLSHSLYTSQFKFYESLKIARQFYENFILLDEKYNKSYVSNNNLMSIVDTLSRDDTTDYYAAMYEFVSNIGNLNHKQKTWMQSEKARQKGKGGDYLSAIDILNQEIKKQGNDYQGVMNTADLMIQQSHIYRRAGNQKEYKKVITGLVDCISNYYQNHKKNYPMNHKLAYGYSKLSEILYFESKYKDALNSINKSIEIENSSGDGMQYMGPTGLNGLSMMYGRKSTILRKLNKSIKAVAALNKSLDYINRALEENKEYGGLYISKATSLGKMSDFSEEYEKKLSYLSNALELIENDHARYADNYISTNLRLRNKLANLFNKNGEPERALKVYRGSISLLKKECRKISYIDDEMQNSIRNLFALYRRNLKKGGFYSKIKNTYNNELSFYRDKEGGLNAHPNILEYRVQTKIKQAVQALEEENESDANEHIASAFTLAERLYQTINAIRNGKYVSKVKYLDIVLTLNRLGSYLSEKGENEKALTCFKTSLESVELGLEYGSIDERENITKFRIDLYRKIIGCYRRLDNFEQEFEYRKQQIVVMERDYAFEDQSEFKVIFDKYNQLGKLCYTMGKAEDAIGYYMKAVEYRDGIINITRNRKTELNSINYNLKLLGKCIDICEHYALDTRLDEIFEKRKNYLTRREELLTKTH